MIRESNPLRAQNGSSTIFALSLAIACIFILLALFDLCCIYITREETKVVSESIALAIAQEVLFFDLESIEELADSMAEKSRCRLASLVTDYDEIEVSVIKETDIRILGRIGLDCLKTISSSSRVKIIYPWDRKLGMCSYYEFGYKPY